MYAMTRRVFFRYLSEFIVRGMLSKDLISPFISHDKYRVTNDYSGINLAGWEMALGDGIYAASGEQPVNINDIDIADYLEYSELRANILNRRVMAHNITFKRIVNGQAFNYIHTCSYKFRLPYLPSQANIGANGQTLEGGIFVWDGSRTRLDYGIGYQWILNPWDNDFGSIKTWVNEENGNWITVGKLTPNTDWHDLKLTVDFRRETTALVIDQKHYLTQYSKTPKSETWGTEIAARFQAEIISLYPGEQGEGAFHKAQFKDWQWIWEI